ncbi:MAG: EAL domain-containing protein, partial [Porticoccaceae bacterium]|nr:EAL domain-containing protein [Porticoccaceae bacterium]
KSHLKQQNEQSLQVARIHFQLSLKQQHDELVDKAATLLRNPEFTRSIISANRNIITHTLNNLPGELQTDRLLVVGSNKKIIFDSGDTLKKGQQFFDPVLLTQANSTGFSSGFMLETSDAYLVSFVPVQLADLVIWIGLARQVTEANLEVIKNNIALPVNLSLITRPAEQSSAINVSTTPATMLDAVYPIFEKLLRSRASTEPVATKLLDEDIVASIDKLAELPDNTEVFAGIYFSIDDALAINQPLFNFLLLIVFLGVAIASIGCFYVARSVTTPIRTLDESVARIASGNYQQRVQLYERNEIGRLGQALNLMMESLESRSKETEYRLTHDLATGLANRDFLEKKLTAWIDTEQQFSTMLVDIAHFSEINNILGHEKGDKLIVDFSKRLKSLIKSSDLIARLTGKSFVIVLLDTSIDEMENVAQRVITGMDKPFEIDEDNVDTEIYMGVANYPAHGDDSRTLLRKAETALDEARHHPLRFATYDKRSDPYKPEMLSLMGELRQGLKKGEFFFQYQPKLDLASGLITGCEALVRWNHPDRGKVFPDEFIELAERSGNIGELTLWGLSEAMRQVEEWQALEIDVTIAVNLSVRDIQYRQFSQRVKQLLTARNIDPSYIHLEITETEMMAKPELSLNILQNLSAMGFKLVIDDYGIGYSSMAYIKQLPVSEIKIDRSFVTQLLDNQNDNVIVNSTIEMVHSLGLKVTAEGVEDKNTLDHLKKIGCDYIQGYYISKPLEQADFEHLFLQHNSLGHRQRNNSNLC